VQKRKGSSVVGTIALYLSISLLLLIGVGFLIAALYLGLVAYLPAGLAAMLTGIVFLALAGGLLGLQAARRSRRASGTGAAVSDLLAGLTRDRPTETLITSLLAGVVAELTRSRADPPPAQKPTEPS
jgi:hypothetical protein